MFAAWSRVSRERRNVWMLLAGAITAATIFKVYYFKLSRGVMVDDAKRSHADGMQRLQEAKAYADWSQTDRDAKLPKLTDEQHDQLQQYLRLVEQHGWNRSMEASTNGGNCEGCPIVNFSKRKKPSESSAEK